MELRFGHLLGRPYEPGREHCYSLVRDFFRDNFGLELTNYAVPHDWDSDVLDLIGLIHEREGFEKVHDWTLINLRPADVLCVAVQSGHPNHFMINVGSNQLLHHPLMKASTVDPMRSFWRMATCYVLRHPSVPDLTPVKEPVSIKELVDARYRVAV